MSAVGKTCAPPMGSTMGSPLSKPWDTAQAQSAYKIVRTSDVKIVRTSDGKTVRVGI